MADEKQDPKKRTHFTYKPLPGAQGRGAGEYTIDDPGLGGQISEYARVGEYSREEFQRQRAAAKKARDEGY